MGESVITSGYHLPPSPVPHTEAPDREYTIIHEPLPQDQLVNLMMLSLVNTPEFGSPEEPALGGFHLVGTIMHIDAVPLLYCTSVIT